MSVRYRVSQAALVIFAFHGDQRWGELPYSFHLKEVLHIGRTLVTDDMLKAAGISREEHSICCLGHDLFEDTKILREQVLALWGAVVRDTIQAVTNKPRPLNKMWGSKDDPGPLVLMRKCPAGILVKLPDRIMNWESSIQGCNVRFVKKYLREYNELQSVRDVLPEAEPLWVYLDGLEKRSIELLEFLCP